MRKKTDYSVYLVTDRDLMSEPSLELAIEKAIRGGVSLVQLREKNIDSLEFYQLALRAKEVCDKHQIPLIINDRLDIAMAARAAGAHLGQSDMPADVARRILGGNAIIGVSVSSAEQAVKAAKDGADYLGAGAMFSTDTKDDAEICSFEELEKIRRSVDIPIVVIGGINKETIPLFKNSGIDGLAVVSAIISQPDIELAAREIRTMFIDEVKNHGN